MPRKSCDPYSVLGVPSTATSDEIRRAYHRQVRLHHPDTKPASQSAPFDDVQFHRLLTAYAVLRDPDRRASYDRAVARRNRTAMGGFTAQRSGAETPIRPNSAGSVRVLGLTFDFRAKWLSE